MHPNMGWRLPALSAVLAVIALTVAGAAIGLAVHGPVGALAGVVPGALAGVIAGFVPGIRGRADQRRAELVRLDEKRAAAQAAWDAIGEPEPGDPPSGPGAWLRPDRAVVEFTGRHKELAELEGWLASDQAHSVRVVVGAGGVGKTRLALNMAARWATSGEWRLVADGEEGNAISAARQVTSAPLLLVVDYAETRAGLEVLLRAALADRGPLRILLLARSLGEWWDRLVEKSASAVGRLLTEAAPLRLDAPVTETQSDAELAAAAVPFFARALKVSVPERVEFELPADRVPVLVLHAAALVTVLRFAVGPGDSAQAVVVDEVLDELLEHEARYWRRTASAAGLPDDGTVLKPVVAAAALQGATDLEEAAELVRRVPELAGASLGDRRRWARWLFGLYPAGSDGRLGSMQPDLLAETHVADQLGHDPRLARTSLLGLSEGQAERALTVLARAWTHHDVRPIIVAALHSDLARLAIPAARVALQTKAELGELLAAALRDAPARLEVLTGIAKNLPYPSVVLTQADLAVTLRIRQALLPDALPQTVAEWDDRTWDRLSQMARPADSLPVIQEAVAIRRELAQANPEFYRPGLAQSLTNMSISFGELGRPADSLPVIQEALAIRRELAQADPSRYQSDLAQSLMDLGIVLSELGRRADSQRSAQEAVAIYRQLDESNPGCYARELALSLTNLGVALVELGRWADALLINEEAITIRRKLDKSNPDRYRGDLANSLTNLGSSLAGLGRWADALPIEQEAVVVHRELAQANPDRYRPDLANSLTNLGLTFACLRRPADGLDPAREAVTIYREAAQDNPDRYRPDLANSLSNLGRILVLLDRPADGLDPAREAVTIYREAAQDNPDRYRPDLTGSLAILDAVLSALGLDAEAGDACA
jgi:hypothetical protein